MARSQLSDADIAIVAGLEPTQFTNVKAKLLDHDLTLDALMTPSAAAGAITAQAVATVVDTTVTAQSVRAAVPVVLCFDIPDAATTTYTAAMPDKIEVIDVECIKFAAGAGNTVQLFNGGTAISDAIATAVDKTVTRAGTIDRTQNVIAAAANLSITVTRAAGSGACKIYVHCLKRP